jgi:cell division protein FtsQ
VTLVRDADDDERVDVVSATPPRRSRSSTAPASPQTPRWKRRLRALAVLGVVTLLLASPWWLRRAAVAIPFFHLRVVEVNGLRYLSASEVLQRLSVDTSVSIFIDLGPARDRVAAHPQVSSVDLSRRLPSTLVVDVVENVPVALVPSANGFKAYDDAGTELPLDPSRVPVDVPVVSSRDTSLLRLLGDLRAEEPALYARVSELRRVGRGELLVSMIADSANTLAVPVRASADLTARRLADIRPVESDLTRRQARVAELDLRFRDQVIARLQ